MELAAIWRGLKLEVFGVEGTLELAEAVGRWLKGSFKRQSDTKRRKATQSDANKWTALYCCVFHKLLFVWCDRNLKRAAGLSRSSLAQDLVELEDAFEAKAPQITDFEVSDKTIKLVDVWVTQLLKIQTCLRDCLIPPPKQG